MPFQTARTVCLRSRVLVLAAGIAGAVAVGVGGCESTRRAMTPDERAAATPVQHDAYGQLGYRLEWRGYPTMTAGETVERMETLGEVVVVQETGSTVTVLEAASGRLRWSDPPAGALTRFVGIIRDEKQLMVSSEAELFIYDIDTGALLTKQVLAQVVNTRPVKVGPILVYGCANGQVLGHLLLNGFRQWGSYVNGAIEVDPVLLGGDDTVALVSRMGDVLLLDGRSGLGRGRASMFRGSSAPLAASESILFVASVDHSLYAFSREGASPMWRKRTDAPLKFSPTYHEGRVYCDMGRAGLSCFDAASGEEVWAAGDVHGTVVALRGGRLVVWDGSTATLVDPAKGQVVERARLEKVSLLVTDKFVDGHVYLASPDGVISRLAPRN